MAVMAYKCTKYRFTVVDINPQRIKQWNSEELPIYEPGLDEIVQRKLAEKTSSSLQIWNKEFVTQILFFVIDITLQTFGEGAGVAADLQYWEKTARQIAEMKVRAIKLSLRVLYL